jgi:Ca2+-binding RTX toxin-like protein
MGSIDYENDVDVYAFDVTQNDAGFITLTFDIDGANETGLDTQIQLFNSAGQFIQDNDDGNTLDPGSSNGRDSLMTFTPVDPGTYYIAVTSYDNDWRGTGDGSGGNSTGDYILNVSVSGAQGVQSYGNGSMGSDQLFGDNNGDVIDDTIRGFAGDDSISGYAGNDMLVGGDGADAIAAGEGDDWLYGDSTNPDHASEGPVDEDTLYGGNGNDYFYGGRGDDTLWGDAGDDRMYGDAGSDRFIGGAGADFYEREAPQYTEPDTFVFAPGDSAPGAYDIFDYGGPAHFASFNGAGVEGGDTIAVTGIGHRPIFFHGQTAFSEALGSPVSGGGNGAIDAFFNFASASTSWLLIDLDDTGSVSAGDLLMKFDTAATDQPVSSMIASDFKAGEAFAPVVGTAADESYTGTSAPDFFLSGAGSDVLKGVGGNDLLQGEAGQDRLYGGSADDSLSGGSERDTLSGGSGRDTLSGDGDSDTLTGGVGRDVFAFHAVGDSTGTKFDVITDFDADDDKLSFAAPVSALDTAVNSGTLRASSFNSDLRAAVGRHELHAGDAVLFTPAHGTYAAHTFLIVDANGTAGYQANADYVIDVTGMVGALHPNDFVLTPG